MTVLATAHAATAPSVAAAGFLSWVFILGVGYAILTLFVRRIDGKGGGSEKRIVGVGTFLAAVIGGLYGHDQAGNEPHAYLLLHRIKATPVVLFSTGGRRSGRRGGERSW
jgi:hypothetical protein